MRITGLDSLEKTLRDAQKALAELDGEIGTVSFDPDDPSSIEDAIQAVERMIDAKIEPYQGNSIIGPMADQMKEQYREAILERATEARLEGDAD